MRAFSWSGDALRSSLSAKERGFFSDASDYDIRSGVSIPIAAPNGAISMLTFASSKPKLVMERDINAIAAASAVGQLHAHIEHLRVRPTIEEQVYLTPKEATYLRWIELGKTVDETADLEQVKYSTVRITLDGAKERYNLTNNTQLVGLAIRRGLI
jgi:LuxR family transcriptional activator of conjugal transfer of Ti plasmids